MQIDKPQLIEGLPKTRFEAVDYYSTDLEQAHQRKDPKWTVAVYRENCVRDLFFLLVFALKSTFLNNDFMFYMCREVQARPNGRLDLWSRGHGKTTLALGLIILDILRDPKVTIGIFYHDAKSARALLRQIKTYFETSIPLRSAFPEIFYVNPQSDSPLWNVQDGIIVRRIGNPREATVEANSIMSLPTGKHYSHLIFDDLSTEESVNTYEQKQKSIQQFGLATALATRAPVKRVYGTFYAPDDIYNWMIDRKSFVPRIIPATDDGTPTGVPVFWTDDEFREAWNSKTEYIANCQLLLNPKVEDAAGFREEWWQEWPNTNHENLNLYAFIDPAQSKKKGADNTAMWLIGYGADQNLCVIDFIYDKLSLTEKADRLFAWHHKYPILETHYEQVAMQGDIAHMNYRMEKENYRFTITPFNKGKISKKEHIKKLEPWLSGGRIFFPPHCFHINYKGEKVDMLKMFYNNEYVPYPILTHDDGLDGLAMIDYISFKSPLARKQRTRKRSNSNAVVYGTFAGY